MTINVLFVCPHSAGKSLFAATYFRAAAARLGLDVAIDVAGPDPDPVNMPNVQAAIESQGYTVGWEPKRIDEHHTRRADLVVSVGCPVGEIPAVEAVREWDVPLLSDEFESSMLAIHARAESLAVELAGSRE